MSDFKGKKPFVIVGGSAAGTAAVQELCARGCTTPIVWIADQHMTPYNTIEIPKVLAGKYCPEQIALCSMDALPSIVTPLFGKRVVRVEPDLKEVVLDDGSIIEYQKLLLAVGAKRTIPAPFSECTGQGLFLFCTLSHALAIKDYIAHNNVKSAVVVGLGLNGTELHDVLSAQGIVTHAVDRHDHILYRFADMEGGHFLQKRLEDAGVTLHLNATVQEIFTHDGKVSGIKLQDGTEIPCQLLIFTAAGTPDKTLLASANLELIQDGIKVNNALESSQPDIYAAGDVAAIMDFATKQVVRSRKWPDAQAQGKIAAASMLGDTQACYRGTVITQDSHLFGVDFVSCGSIAEPPAGTDIVAIKTDTYYHRYILQDDRLIGFLLIGPSGIVDVNELKRIVMDEVLISREDIQSRYA